MRRGISDIGGAAQAGPTLEGAIDFQLIEDNLRTAYRQIHRRYRQDDELDVATESHRHIAETLCRISASFGRPISVLDVGCGTGRYFHCLKRTTRLVGVDLSEDMLLAARTPVRQEEVSAENIELICANIHRLAFPPQSFDFIYSIGMFGNGCPVTVHLCNQFHDWLNAGGKLFFNALHVATLPLSNRLRKQLRRRILPVLPSRWRRILAQRDRAPFFGLTGRKLRAILGASRFSEFNVSRPACRSPLWHSLHLECIASKPVEFMNTSTDRAVVSSHRALLPRPPRGA